MNDWEYYVEEMENERVMNEIINRDPHGRSLSCQIDGIEEEIWDWHPGKRESAWLSRIKTEFGIGEAYYLVQHIYREDEQEQLEESNKKYIDSIYKIHETYYVCTQRPGDAHFEVLHIKRNALSKLRAVVQQLNKRENTLKEILFIEMIAAIILFMEEEHPDQKEFVLELEI